MNKKVTQKFDKLNSELKRYVDEEMILEFEDFEEIRDYINLNCPEVDEKVESVDDLKRILGEYGFCYNGKYYDIQFDEALAIRDFLPKGHFKILSKVSYVESYEIFEAYFKGRVEGQTERFIGELINKYSNEIGCGDWMLSTKKIKDKNDFLCFKDREYFDGEFGDDCREEFVEELSHFLEKEIDIDDPKTWLPFLKAKFSWIEDDVPHIVTIKEDLENILDRLYDAIIDYNEIIDYSWRIIWAYSDNYEEMELDNLKVAFLVGELYNICNDKNNSYTQKRIYEKVINAWQEFDGFNYDLED